MRLARGWVVVVVVAVGCGPRTAADDLFAETSSTSTTGSSSATTAAGSTEDSAGVSSSTIAATDGTSAGSSSGGESEASTSSTTGDPIGPISYCADHYLDAITRVAIWRRDETAGLCAVVLLKADDSSGWDGPTLEVPRPYVVEWIMATNELVACGDFPFLDTFPTAAEGTVETVPDPWSPHPSSVSIDATLYFDPVEAWIPEQIVMQIEDLALTYACDHDEDAWVPGP